MKSDFIKQARKTDCPNCKKKADLYEKQNEWRDLYIVCEHCGLDEIENEFIHQTSK